MPENWTSNWTKTYKYNQTPEDIVSSKLAPKVPIMGRLIHEGTNLPIGVTDITEHVSQGNMKFHPKNTKEYYFDGTAKDKGVYFRDPETGSIYYDEIVKNKLQPALNLSKFEILSRNQIEQMYPKRDYIGGTSEEVRTKALDKIPWVKNYIKTLGKTYNIDPNVLFHRFTKEGYLDHLVQEYNHNIASVDQNDYFDNMVDNEVHGFNDMGLDDFGSNYQTGLYNLRREIPFRYTSAENEKGRTVTSAIFNNLKDALEAKAADMEYRTKLAKERGVSDADMRAYVNAMYNMGVNHKDLNNMDYVRKTYGFDPYYKKGGILKSQSGNKVDFTGIQTTDNRKYDPKLISYINEKLDTMDIERRASVLGQIIEESGGSPFEKSKNDTYQGLLQWGKDRYRIPKNATDTLKTIDSQLQYFIDSSKKTNDRVSWTHGGSGSGYNSLKEPFDIFWNPDSSLEDTHRAFSWGYVRPEGKAASEANRLKVAKQVYDRLLKAKNNE